MTSGTTSRNTPPSVIAERYTVERTLGRGGMATVYLCIDSKTHEKVAVKVLREELGSAVVVERFLREIAFASELDHPAIPKVLGSGVTGSLPYYVMTYVEGESLRQRLDREKQLPVEEAVRITAAVIEPMTYAHRAGIVHRDIKPGNILVGPGSVHVLDFGIARAIIASADERLTSTGVAVGTPAYMSPEQALADGHLDARSDIYSLACVTYEMIAGLPPFVGVTPQAVMARRFGAPPAPLSETREGVPPHVEHAVAKALLRAPADRWQTASEFASALTHPTPPESVQAVRTQVATRRRTYGRVIAGILALVVVVAGYFAASASRKDAVARAVAAIEAWDLDAATSQLSAAAAKNPNDPRSQLWLAHVLLVRGAPESQWMPYALRALDGRTGLEGADTLMGAAFAGISPHSNGDCERWTPLAADSRDKARNILATLAQADCLADDDAVEADPASISNYRFRSSHHRAATLYDGLLTRNAENGRAYAAVMPRLLRVLPTLKHELRRGMSVSDDPKIFVAYASLVSDTIAYIPIPVGRGSAPIRSQDPAGLARAVERSLELLQEKAAAWVEVSGRDPDAHETLGLILERSEQLSGNSSSALAHIDEARRTAARRGDTSAVAYMRNLRLAVTEVRVLLKLRHFDDAASLADSVLSWPMRQLDPAEARSADDMLASLAALTGRVSRMVDINGKYAADYPVGLPSGAERVLPPELGADAHRLADYSAIGGPADSIVAIADRVELKLAALVPVAQLADMRMAVLRRPLSLAAATIGAERAGRLGASSDPFLNAVTALARGNTRRAKAYADSAIAVHVDMAPGEITMDAVLQQGWLLTAIGDTARAVQMLDNALRGLSKMPAQTLREPSIAASLVRTMILRAEIARKAGDARNASEWGAAAAALWGRGDAEPKQRVAALPRTR